MSERFRIIRWKEVFKPSPAVLRHKLTGEGYSVFHWVDAVGTIYGIHKHDADQTHWIISGELEISLENGFTYSLKTGDRDYMPAETWHRAQVIGNEPVNYIVGEKIKVKRKRGRPKKNL